MKLAAAVALWGLTCICLAPGMALTAERVIVTLGGGIETSNRGATGPDDVTMFRALGVEFDKGFAVDEATLAGLPQRTIQAPLPGTDMPEMSFSGPALADVAALAGAAGKTLSPLALDGYQIDIPPELIATYDPILATHIGDVPLGLGDLGPAMVVFPRQDDPALEEELGGLEVWAVIYIEVR
ncbi:MAG: hypothetical protein AAGA28_08055 [Pseudomonadota bacterium]